MDRHSDIAESLLPAFGFNTIFIPAGIIGGIISPLSHLEVMRADFTPESNSIAVKLVMRKI